VPRSRREQGSTAYDVARAIPWTSRDRRFDELDAYNQALAVMEAVWHLDVLAAQGDLDAALEPGDVVVRYQRVLHPRSADVARA
jgi:hypothetical protein